MTTRLSGQVMVALLICVGAAGFAGAASQVYFPTGHTRWTVAIFIFIGPESPNYTAQGGIRHHFANEQALASWGKFRDGAVIVDERVHARLNDQGVWQEDGLAHVAVIRKDARHHPDTGGWYFNFFMANDTAIGITPEQAKARCFDACHKSQGTRDYVFSDPRH